PAVDQTPSAKETDPFKTDESAATLPHILHAELLLGYRSEMSHLHHFGLIRRFISTPPPSPLSPWSSPLP
ncbi:hypothetical protein Tco_0498471, partial [Tanacetum coccineum]